MKQLQPPKAEQVRWAAPPPCRSIDDLRDATFLDSLADAFTFPEDLPLALPDHGLMARVRDGQRMREDFRNAVKGLRIEKGQSSSP